MAKSYETLKDVLITKLNSIKGKDGNSLFAGVYSIFETEPEGYPVAMLTESAGEGSSIDTHRNKREWEFLVTIKQEVGNKKPELARVALIDALDRTVISFDQDPYLLDINEQPQCLWVEVSPVEIDFDIEDTSAMTATLQIKIIDTVDRQP